MQLNQTENTRKENNRYIPDDFEIDPDFKRLVSYNTTAVHIPTDIYEGCKFMHTSTCIAVYEYSSFVSCLSAPSAENTKARPF